MIPVSISKNNFLFLSSQWVQLENMCFIWVFQKTGILQISIISSLHLVSHLGKFSIFNPLCTYGLFHLVWDYLLGMVPGRVAQSVTCLVTDAKLTADPGVASSIQAQSHTFVEIDHEMISMVILLPSAESFIKGCCQLQAKVCARLLVNRLFKLAQEKSVVRWTDRPAMTIAVDLGRKATNKQTNKTN